MFRPGTRDAKPGRTAPGHSPGLAERADAGSRSQAMGAAVLAMQRSAGNAAVVGLIGGGGPVTLARQPDDSGGTGGPGTEFTPVKVVKKGKRISFELALHLKRSAGGGGSVDGRLLKTSAEGLGGTLGTALGEVTVEVGEIVPGVKFEVDLTALEATVSATEIDLSLMKIQIGVTGALSKEIAGTALGKQILAGPMGPALQAGLTIEVEGKFQIELAPEDAARIARMATVSRQMAENGVELIHAKDAQKRLLEEQRRLKKLQRQRGAKLSDAKRKELAGRIRKNAEKLDKIQGTIFERTRVNSRLLDEGKIAQKGLKTKIGRTVAKGVAKLGGKLLSKLIPGLNIVTTAMDLIELGGTLYKLAKGEVEFSIDGGGGEGDAGTKDAQDAGGGADADSDTAADAGVGEPAGPSGDEDELPPEVDVTEALDTSDLDAMGISGEKNSAEGPPPELHPAAEAVTRALRDRGGVRFTPRDLAQLRDVIPPDLSGAELDAVIAHLKSGGPKATDVYAAIGSVIAAVRGVRAEPGGTTVTADGETEITLDEGLDLSEDIGDDASPGETPDERPDLVPFLEAAKTAMGAESSVWGTFEPLPRASMKPGAVIHATIAIRSEDALVGGSATFVLKRESAKDRTWEATLMAMDVYDEAGKLVGRLPSETSGGWRIPSTDEAGR